MKFHLLEHLSHLSGQSYHELAPWKWHDEVPHKDVKLVQQEHMELVVEPALETLEHDYNAPSYGFFHILYQENKAKEDLEQVSRLELFETDLAKMEKSSYQTLSISPPCCGDTTRNPATFVSLGRLVKIQRVASDEGIRLTTNYVVLLNLTTNPISVWLMYDYHIPTDDAYPLKHLNALEDYRHPYPYLSNQEAIKVPRGEPLPEVSRQILSDNNLYRSFRSTVLHVEEKCLVSSSSEVPFAESWASVAESGKRKDNPTIEMGTSNCSTEPYLDGVDSACSTKNQSMHIIDGYHRSSLSSTASSQEKLHNGCEGDESHLINTNNDARMDLNGTSSNDTSSSRPMSMSAGSKIDTSCKGGLFDQIPPFDLTLLAPNWAAWGLNGLHTTDTLRWIASSHVRLESSMRACSTFPERFDTNFVDFRPLCRSVGNKTSS